MGKWALQKSTEVVSLSQLRNPILSHVSLVECRPSYQLSSLILISRYGLYTRFHL